MSQATPSRGARERPRNALRRRLGLVLACAAVAAALLPLQSHSPDADETFYLGALRSLYFDGDVDLRNEALHYTWIEQFPLLPRLPDGRIANPFPIGSALLWLPFYALADATVWLAGSDPGSGFAGPYRRAVAFGTTFWVMAGLLLLRASLLRLGAAERWGVAVPAVTLLATPLVGYVVHAPFMAHGNGFFMSSLVLWLCLELADSDHSRLRDWAICGLAVGLAFSVRWQDALLVALPVAVGVARWRDGAGPCSARGAALTGGALLGALPQLAYWRDLYGRWIVEPLGSDFLSVAHMEPAAFLFSTWNGVFACHPVLLGAFVGLLLPGANRAPWSGTPWLRPAALAVVTSQALLCMAAADWWAGGAFGQRRLVSVLPLMALGLCAVTQRIELRWPERGRRWVASAFALLSIWNLLALVQLRRGVLPYNPADPASYAEGVPWGHYDHARRAGSIVFGRPAEMREERHQGD